MAVSVNWGTKVITVPKADTTLVDSGPPEVRTYSINDLRLELKALEDDEEGIWADDTHEHNTEKTLSGIVFARQVEFVNGYSITFEDGAYILFLTGANHNVLDVANYNNVQLRANLTAGMVVSGSGITEQDKNDIRDKVWAMIIEGSDDAIDVLIDIRKKAKLAAFKM